MSAKDQTPDVKLVTISQDQLPTPPEWATKSPQYTGGTVSGSTTVSHEGAVHHSASFKSVIKHNEDLMARLTVSLRRVSHLEKHVEDLKQRLNSERAAADGLRDEVLISAEKNRLMDSDFQKQNHLLSIKDKTIAELNNQISFVESRYAELKATKDAQLEEISKEHSEAINKVVSEYELKMSSLELQMQSLEKYRHKTQTEFKPQFKRLKLLCEKQMDKISQLGVANQNLTARLKMSQTLQNKTVSSLKESRAELRAELRDLKSRFLQVLKKASASEKQAQDSSAQISELEKRNQELESSISELKNQTQNLESQIHTYEGLRLDLSQKLKSHESEIANKNKQIDDLYKVIESLKSSASENQDAVIDSVLQGMKNLYFTEEPQPPEAASVIALQDKGL